MKKVFTMYSEHLFTMYPVCTLPERKGELRLPSPCREGSGEGSNRHRATATTLQGAAKRNIQYLGARA